MFPMVMAPRLHQNFLMDDPLILLRDGYFKKVDIMMGLTRDELVMLVQGASIIYLNEENNNGA